jgi:hypothetical protein
LQFLRCRFGGRRVPPALGAFPGDNVKIAFLGDCQGGDFDTWTA